MDKTLNLLKVVLWSVCLFHLLVGAGLNLSESMAPLMAKMYGAEVNWNPELSYIIKPLGVFMVALGVAAAGAAMDPLKNRVIIYSFATLFVLRAIQRLVFAQEIEETFSIAWSRNLGNMFFFLGLAATLIILDMLAHKRVVPTNSGPSTAAPTAS